MLRRIGSALMTIGVLVGMIALIGVFANGFHVILGSWKLEIGSSKIVAIVAILAIAAGAVCVRAARRREEEEVGV